jgi:hypothetical protein
MLAPHAEGAACLRPLHQLLDIDIFCCCPVCGQPLQVGLLAAALICEAAGVPAAAGEALDLLAAAPGGRAGGVMRRSLLLTERLAFPILR